MITTEARIDTERPSRYLTQFCKHATSMGGAQGHRARLHLNGKLARSEVEVHVDCTDTRATVTFTPWGQCTLVAEANTLTVRIDAADEQNLQRIQDVITRDLESFGRRDQLSVSWCRSEDQKRAPQ